MYSLHSGHQQQSDPSSAIRSPRDRHSRPDKPCKPPALMQGHPATAFLYVLRVVGFPSPCPSSARHLSYPPLAGMPMAFPPRRSATTAPQPMLVLPYWLVLFLPGSSFLHQPPPFLFLILLLLLHSPMDSGEPPQWLPAMDRELPLFSLSSPIYSMQQPPPQLHWPVSFNPLAEPVPYYAPPPPLPPPPLYPPQPPESWLDLWAWASEPLPAVPMRMAEMSSNAAAQNSGLRFRAILPAPVNPRQCWAELKHQEWQERQLAQLGLTRTRGRRRRSGSARLMRTSSSGSLSSSATSKPMMRRATAGFAETITLPPDRKLKFLVQKDLKNSDVNSLGRIIIPKREAESNLPYLKDKEGMKITFRDVKSPDRWKMKYRFWPNNKSRMYVLENTAEYARKYSLRAGDLIALYKDEKNKFYICHKKVKRPTEHMRQEEETQRLMNQLEEIIKGTNVEKERIANAMRMKQLEQELFSENEDTECEEPHPPTALTTGVVGATYEFGESSNAKKPAQEGIMHIDSPKINLDNFDPSMP